MRLKLIRLQFTPLSTCGELWIDGGFFCYTLERPENGFIGAAAPFSIPRGIYNVTPRWSEHNKTDVLGVNNVPGRTDIEFHVANWPSQLLGCIAVGTVHSQDYVGNSKLAFDGLMEKTKEQELTLEVV